MKSSAALALVLPLVAALPAHVAHASGPVEVLMGIYFDPEDAQRLIVRYDNSGSKTGLIYSDDAGATFNLVCTSAIAEAALRATPDASSDLKSETRSSLLRARMALVTGGGRTLVGTTSGLFEDDGTGCGYRAVSELGDLWIAGLASTADEPRVGYVLTNGGSDDPQEGLWKRDADGTYTKLSDRLAPPDGQSWTNSGLLAAKLSAGGTRFYTVQLRFDLTAGGATFSLLSSDDDGAHWSEHDLDDVPDQASFYLLGVDPTNEDRVLGMYQRSKDGGDYASNKDTVLVSEDGGQTFAPYFDGTTISGAQFMADGTLWISDSGSESGDLSMPMGLYKSAPGLASQPEHVITDQSITCVGAQSGGSDLYLCHRTDFGRYDPSSKTFTQLTSMTSVQSIKSCAGQDVAADCHDQLCMAGWCGPVHFASAPMCTAYHEQYCGPQAEDWANGGPDGGSMPGDGGASEGHSDGDGDSLLDGGAPDDSGLGASKHAKDTCAVHPSGSTASPSLSALFTLLAALGLRLRRTRKDPSR